MSATTNTNTAAAMSTAGLRPREIDFVTRFNSNLKSLRTILGIMRPIRKQPGTTLVSVEASVSLAESVGEGEEINLSEVTYVPSTKADLTVKKYKTSTTIEAVEKYGAELAVEKTDDAFLNELQTQVMGDFYTFALTGTLTDTEPDFQVAVAMAVGLVSDKWKKMHKGAGETIVFVNTLDFYRYLGTTNITTQMSNGIEYIKGFMGVNTMVITSDIPEGKVVATVQDNIDLYYIDPSDSSFAQLGLDYTVAGETNLIGFHAEGNYDRAVGNAYALMGMKLWAEYHDGIVVVTIDDAPYDGPTVAAATQESYWGHTVDSLQSDVTVTGDSITGTLHYVNSGALATDWGPGNFIALKFTPSGSDTTATKYRVGLNPSEGSGMQELDSDMDGVFKVTDPKRQWLMVETSNADGTHVTTKVYKLSGLVCEKA